MHFLAQRSATIVGYDHVETAVSSLSSQFASHTHICREARDYQPISALDKIHYEKRPVRFLTDVFYYKIFSANLLMLVKAKLIRVPRIWFALREHARRSSR